MSFIEIKNLKFSYHSGDLIVKIFDHFNLNIEKGDFVAIKGPSGSGKSTLLYLLAGLLKMQGGEINIDKKNISHLSNGELAILRNKKMAFVFQQFHLLPKATVRDNILLPTLYPVEENNSSRNSLEKVEAIAEELGIKDRLEHYPNQLSGGQQQRVAIARALVNDAEIILADEPTGNLDSKSTEQIIEILKRLHEQGKTIILITHEDEVAKAASTICFFKDGKIEKIKNSSIHPTLQNISDVSKLELKVSKVSFLQYTKMIPLAVANSFRNKTRSFLTMLGITVGVAAVCSMITLGNFTKNKILESYAELGVNTIKFRGYPNWQLKATDRFPLKYQFFNWNDEILPLKKIFPRIEFISPNMMAWNVTVTYGGKSIQDEGQLVGISEDGLRVLNRDLIAGTSISEFHVLQKNSVCVIGYDIGGQLFKNTSPIGQIIHVSQDSSSFACEIIGVLSSKTTNKDWIKPNLQVFVPFTVFQAMSEYWWTSQIKEFTIQFYPDTDVEAWGKGIRKFFEQKYGISGNFRVDSDSILVAQMKKFLTLFSILLAVIALVSLSVGGMGITNMMLVSVSERFKEIGIRKSVGATDLSVRYQFLFESIFLCTLAGTIGLLLGIAAYQGAIWGASQVMEKLNFEWVFDPVAILLSCVSILAVGILSGLAPALKAEKLQVVEALRSE